MKKRRLKKKFIVFFYIYALILSSFFITKTFSKYSSNYVENANVEVAKWDVSANLPDADITIAPVSENTYTLTVTSNSEVSLSYSIKISNLSKNTYVVIDNDRYSNGENIFTFSNYGNININDQSKTKTHILKFISTPAVTEATNRIVKIEVIFTQKKPQ